MILDEESKAELLTFLVVSQLLAFACSGTWLRIDHLIESSQIWLSSNGVQCDWLERARLVTASYELALKAQERSVPADEAGLLKLFNLKTGWFLDYRSPIVREIHKLCTDHLRSRT
jgi:hypothetical protein